MKVKCKHWQECGVIDGGCCTIGEYARPSHGVCLKICKANTHPQPEGLGDTVKRLIDKVTLGKIKECGGCKKRQNALNKLLPYRDKDNDN